MTNSSAPDPVITFSRGLPGFEGSRQFVLITSPAMAPFAMLQGTGASSPSFVGIDPRMVDPSYNATLTAEDLSRLDAVPGAPLLWIAIVAAQDDGHATVNLRAPVVINPASMRGLQLLTPDSPYRLDHPLVA